MDWLWPDFLLLLGCIPLLVAVYIGILRRRHRFAVRYSSLSLVDEAIPRSSWRRKHLPFLLFLVALASLVIAMARPLMPEAGLSGQTTIILTLDVSRSMCMRDITPNRLEVARAAADDRARLRYDHRLAAREAHAEFGDVEQVAFVVGEEPVEQGAGLLGEFPDPVGWDEG